MPKQCLHHNCTIPVWGKGYCIYHQYLRTDKKPKPIKKVSDKRAEQNKEYLKVRKEYLTEYPFCEFPGCHRKSTECHHKLGRVEHLLTNPVYFAALCSEHHKWVENNPLQAKAMGLSLDRLTNRQGM